MRISRQLDASTAVGTGQENERETPGELSAGGKTRNGVGATCGCGRRLRIAPSVLAQGPVLCGVCGADFTTERSLARSMERRGLAVVDESFMERRRRALSGTVEVAPDVTGPTGPLPEDREPSGIGARSVTTGLDSSGNTLQGILQAGMLESWREAWGTDAEVLLSGSTAAEIHQLNQLARRALKRDGTLHGPALVIGGHEFMAGDRVVVGPDGVDWPGDGPPVPEGVVGKRGGGRPGLARRGLRHRRPRPLPGWDIGGQEPHPRLRRPRSRRGRRGRPTLAPNPPATQWPRRQHHGRTRLRCGGGTVTPAAGSPTALAAIEYASRGWAVFPCHSPGAGGFCSCRHPGCTSPGKHPRVPTGLHAATTDPATIAAWWRRWPTANVAIRTGAASGLVVIDIDPPHGGDASLARLTTQHRDDVPAVSVRTGSGGSHIYLAHPGGLVRNTAGRLGDGIDVRGDGGYVIAPPSRHPSGGTYAWAGSGADGRHGPYLAGCSPPATGEPHRTSTRLGHNAGGRFGLGPRRTSTRARPHPPCLAREAQHNAEPRLVLPWTDRRRRIPRR